MNQDKINAMMMFETEKDDEEVKDDLQQSVDKSQNDKEEVKKKEEVNQDKINAMMMFETEKDDEDLKVDLQLSADRSQNDN